MPNYIFYRIELSAHTHTQTHAHISESWWQVLWHYVAWVGWANISQPYFLDILGRYNDFKFRSNWPFLIVCSIECFLLLFQIKAFVFGEWRMTNDIKGDFPDYLIKFWYEMEMTQVDVIWLFENKNDERKKEKMKKCLISGGHTAEYRWLQFEGDICSRTV